MSSFQDQLDNVLKEARQQTADIEQYAKEHATDTPEDIEQELKRRLQNLKTRVNEQISAVESSILQHAPKGNEPDYEERKKQYMEFLSGASVGLKTLTDTMKKLFMKLADAVCKIVQWIVEKLPTLLPHIVMLFEKVIFPLLEKKYK